MQAIGSWFGNLRTPVQIAIVIAVVVVIIAGLVYGVDWTSVLDRVAP